MYTKKPYDYAETSWNRNCVGFHVGSIDIWRALNLFILSRLLAMRASLRGVSSLNAIPVLVACTSFGDLDGLR